MTRNIVTRSTVQEPPYTTDLVCIPIAAVPLTLGALVLKSQKYWYASPDDWHRGRKLLAQFGKALLMPCGNDIVNAIDRVYGLLDAGLNGIGRSVSGTGTEADPYVYSPGLAQAHEPDAFVPPSLRSDANVTRALLDNLTNGTVSSVAPDNRNIRQQLQNIYDALVAMGEGDGPTAEQIAQIIALLA